MKFCSDCGQQLTQGVPENFCPNCGQDLKKGGVREGGEATLEPEENRRGINISRTQSDVMSVGFSGSGNIIGKNIVVGSGTINVSQQELAKIKNIQNMQEL